MRRAPTQSRVSTRALAGSPRVGYKLGYTSAAMRAQMGVEHPNYGELVQGCGIAHDGEVAMHALIHPLVEPEIALTLGRDVGPRSRMRDAMRAAVATVHPGVKMWDTRYLGSRFRACDNIADNSSAALYVLGPGVIADSLPDLVDVGVTLAADGEVLERGTGAAALGDPPLALAWLANRLIDDGAPLRAGEIVLTGGLTRAHAAEAGIHFVAHLPGWVKHGFALPDRTRDRSQRNRGTRVCRERPRRKPDVMCRRYRPRSKKAAGFLQQELACGDVFARPARCLRCLKSRSREARAAQGATQSSLTEAAQ